MTTTPAKDAIAILIDMAQNGEIDPWDVDPIAAIDRFLSELGLIDDPQSCDRHADLPQSGQAFLWASMLVLLKADTLDLLQQEEQPPEELELLDFDLLPDGDRQLRLPLHLEHHIRRRAAAPPARRRKVTLQELIEQLEQISAEIETASKETNVSKNTTTYHRSRRDTMRAIEQLAHDENLTEVAQLLEMFLCSNLPKLLPEHDSVDLDRLLEWWCDSNISGDRGNSNREHLEHSPKGERVGVFWALLLLSAQSKVELYQQEFYQDLKIKPLVNDRPEEILSGGLRKLDQNILN
ncbi:MAG: segregation/condensation protein A [Xenococcaceae cyanobacterium]